MKRLNAGGWTRCAAALAAGVALAVASPAAAQDATAAAEDTEEIVITAERARAATKTNTKLIETPQAISVVTAERIAEIGALNLQETLRYTAGVRAESYGLDTRNDNAFVRGFDPVQYLDGMIKQISYALIPRADVFTLERIEVLRGPSSMLYGAGTTGGLLNMVSKRPQQEFGGEIAASYGSFDRKELRLDVTGALDAEGAFSARLLGLARDAELQADRTHADRYLAAPSVRWRPSEDTDVTLLGLWQKDDTSTSQQFLPIVATVLAPKSERLPDTIQLGEPKFDRLESELLQGALLVEHAFSDAVTLRTNLRHVDAKTTYFNIYPDVYASPFDPFIDADDRVVARNAYGTKPHYRISTADTHLQLDFATGPFEHRVLVGLDYWNFRQSSASGFDASTPIDIYAPVYGNFSPLPLSADPTVRQSQTGFYLQNQIRYRERVSLVVGARRDRARSHADFPGSDKQVDHATTFRAGVIVDAFAGLSPFFSYAESFLPVVGIDIFDEEFVPQRGRQLEGGVKWQPAAGTWLSLAGYGIRETNRLTNDPTNALNQVQTGEIRSRGFELEASHAFGIGLELSAAYSFTNAVITKSNHAFEDGERVGDVPKHLASLWLAHSLELPRELGLRLGAGVRYVGSTHSVGGAGELTTPDYTLVDALAELSWRNWSLTLNANNLLDESHYSPCRAFGDCFVGNRRSVVGTLAYAF
jgi:iron complex outermembrane receptor protein